jgi:hypothetical protein
MACSIGLRPEHNDRFGQTDRLRQLAELNDAGNVQDKYGSADVLHLSELERPVIADGEVLVRVHAAGFHNGDVHMMTGMTYLTRTWASGFARPERTSRSPWASVRADSPRCARPSVRVCHRPISRAAMTGLPRPMRMSGTTCLPRARRRLALPARLANHAGSN